MTGPLTVEPYEARVTRIFAVDLDGEAAADLARDPAPTLAPALGVPELDPGFVEMFSSRDLAPMTLSEFLVGGAGLSADLVAPEAARLDARDGYVAILSSPAFRGWEGTLAPAPPLTHLATFREAPEVPPFAPLGSEAAKGHLAPPPPPPGAMPRSRILTVLAAIVLILVLLTLILPGV